MQIGIASSIVTMTYLNPDQMSGAVLMVSCAIFAAVSSTGIVASVISMNNAQNNISDILRSE